MTGRFEKGMIYYSIRIIVANYARQMPLSPFVPDGASGLASCSAASIDTMQAYESGFFATLAQLCVHFRLMSSGWRT